MPGPWELRRGQFRQGGLPRTLVVLSDLRRALRQEERQAWQRLVRVLGHEINNSLAPIHSISSGLHELLKTHAGEGDWVQDVRDGLAVVERRSAGLSRFMAAYSQLARLPPPRLGPVELEGLVGRIAALERRLSVKVAPSPPLCVRADADQLEQLLINLIRNAADAALETGGGVEVSWKRKPLCSLLHHQTRRLRHRPGAQQTDRRGALGQPHTAQCRKRTRVQRTAAPARSTCGVSAARVAR